MKVALREEEYNFLIKMLKFIDGKSYDPVYKNLAERIESMVYSDGIDKIATLEETDTYNILDATNDYIDDAFTGNYTDEEKENRANMANNLLSVIEDEVGIK